MKTRVLFYIIGIFIVPVIVVCLTISFIFRDLGNPLNIILSSYLFYPVVLFFCFIAFFIHMKFYKKIENYVKTKNHENLEEAQHAVVMLPKLILYISVLYGFLWMYLSSLIMPVSGSTRLMLAQMSWSIEVLVGMPMYIFYLRAIEHKGIPIPYTEKIQPMKFGLRTNLVVTLTLLSISSLLIITINRMMIKLVVSAEIIHEINSILIPLILGGLVFSIYIISLLTSGIKGRLNEAHKFAKNLSKGIIPKKIIAVNSRDEFGGLLHYLNSVSTYLKDMINLLKERATETEKVKDNLKKVSNETSRNVEEISNGLVPVNNEMNTLTVNVEQTGKSLNVLTQGFGSLNDELRKQAGMVEESTAAVTEMLASLKSLAEIIQSRIETSKGLVSAAAEGSVQLKETRNTIAEIHSNVETIKATTDIIGDIAEQTNLLAMNASIEAAHAGNAGKGFAVVAGEIRKLAENSSFSSHQIDEKLKQIIEFINKSFSFADNTSSTFNKINQDILNLSNSLEEIGVSISELKAGSDQIYASENGLRDISNAISDNSSVMVDNTNQVSKSMNALSTAAATTYKSVEDIRRGSAAITTTIESLKDQSEHLDKATKSVLEIINRFKIV